MPVTPLGKPLVERAMLGGEPDTTAVVTVSDVDEPRGMLTEVEEGVTEKSLVGVTVIAPVVVWATVSESVPVTVKTLFVTAAELLVVMVRIADPGHEAMVLLSNA